MSKILFSTALLLATLFAVQGTETVENGETATKVEDNRAPVVGILMQEAEPRPEDDEHDWTELSGSYVNFLQAAGVRAAPILLGKDDDYYKKMFDSLNGVIFPGGYNNVLDPIHFNFSESQYYRVADKFFHWAKEANDAGDHFPIFASCMGCETLVMLFTDSEQVDQTHTSCDAWYYRTRLEFVDDDIEKIKQTKMFQHANDEIIQNLKDNDISIHGHRLCLTEQKFNEKSLGQHLKIISKNKDKKNLEFITNMEANNYPFICTWIHPEDTLFATNDQQECKQIPRSNMAIQASQYFARMIAVEAKKSKHTFKDKDFEEKALIFSYKPTLTPTAGDCAPRAYFVKKENSQ